MLTRRTSATALAAIGLMAGAAGAEVVTGTITADNHYALYSSVGSAFTYHGGNETGASGNPGPFNWSIAEPWQFDAGEFLYIAAWSDDAVAQGVLAEFASPSLGKILSGDPRWLVYGTGVNRGDDDPHPEAATIAAHVLAADSGNLWEAPHAGSFNGAAPWSVIAGIDGSAKWMWADSPGKSDPLRGGSGAREMLIFRTVVPAPGTASLACLAGAAVLRRRRR